MSSIDARVKTIVGEVARRQPHTIGDRDTAETLGLDSLAAFDVIVDVEDEFDLDFTDDEVEAVADVGGLVALVARHAGPHARREN